MTFKDQHYPQTRSKRFSESPMLLSLQFFLFISYCLCPFSFQEKTCYQGRPHRTRTFSWILLRTFQQHKQGYSPKTQGACEHYPLECHGGQEKQK